MPAFAWWAVVGLSVGSGRLGAPFALSVKLSWAKGSPEIQIVSH